MKHAWRAFWFLVMWLLWIALSPVLFLAGVVHMIAEGANPNWTSWVKACGMFE